MTACEPQPCRGPIHADLAAFLNEAYADVRALRAVGVEAPDYPEFTVAGLQTRDEQGAETLVAYDEGRIVSAASWRRHDSDPTGILDFVATGPHHRRKGCARRLLAEFESWARGLGLERLQTGPIVDSRLAPACGLLESCGFSVRDPMHMNTTWVIDLAHWVVQPPRLTDGYRVISFQPGDEAIWCELHRSVFGGSATPEWFMGRFGDQPNFDPEGWFFVERDGRKVGMAGAIVWFHDAALTQPSGALVEWVGVLETERGKHLGEALMLSCLNYLAGRRVEPNCIVTQYARGPAVELYKKLGYRFVREWRTYVKAL